MFSLFKFIVFIGLIIANLFQISFSSVVSTGDFNKYFFVVWSPSHVNTSADGMTRSLKLDKESGSAFESNQKFLFGQFDMKMKLVPGNSVGIVVAFYLTSPDKQPNRDEIDSAMLGVAIIANDVSHFLFLAILSLLSVVVPAERTKIEILLQKLTSGSPEDQLSAAGEIRLLAKRNADNRVAIAEAGAIPLLVALLSTPDSRIQEHVVTALLNLSIM